MKEKRLPFIFHDGKVAFHTMKFQGKIDLKDFGQVGGGGREGYKGGQNFVFITKNN